MSWLIPPSDLTPDQQRAIQLAPTENRAIVGGPGSGKTQILLYRARYLSDSLRVPPERFRIFVYTNVLKDYIKTALRDLRLPEENVETFDHWCRTYYQEYINRRLPWNAEAKTPDFASIRRAAMARAANGPPVFDFVLVDEAQDLDEDVFAFLAKSSRHVTVCIDHKQQIYDNGSTEAGILFRLGIRKRNINLIDAFRVSPYLVEVAAQLIPDSVEREAFRNQSRQPQMERQTPLIYFFRNPDEERQMLYQVVRERQLKNERIAILLPQNRQVFGFAKGLTEVGIEVEVPAQRGGRQAFPTHDFSSARAKVMSFHSAKGLTFDSVLMPRLVARSFPTTRPERLERLLFVAITRATSWCYFSTSLDNPLPLLQDKLVPLARSKQISLLEGEPQPAGTAVTEAKGDEMASGNLDFL
jgi:superfamily I DNA/RNA helicase